MSSHIDNNRIAKNTTMLYLRTLVVMIITLYTSRVILKTLGVDDYGVYQVVGGLVTMFSVISNALSSAISRFITFEIGRGDKERLRRVFSSSLLVQILISVVFIIVVESIGGWFLENKMQIPSGRLEAAFWVLHCSVITFCINLISIPYNACLIAHEHMKAFAYVSVLDAILKLSISYAIGCSPIDHLISYALLLMGESLCIRFLYANYCHRHFEESRAKISFDRSIFKDISSFAGWNFLTNTASVLNSQGVNMLMNVYFGVTVNAARGIASQVESAVMQFVSNFTTAIHPQITKSYAAGELDSMYVLVCRGAKFSYLVMLFLVLPLSFETSLIINTWLVKVPDYAIVFARLSLIMGMLDCLGKTSYYACLATGKMKKYAMIFTPVAVLEFPLAWLFFRLGADVLWAYYTYIIVKALCLCMRLYLNKILIGFDPLVFIKQVYFRIIPVTVLSIIPLVIITQLVSESYFRLGLSIVVSCFTITICSLFFGMTSQERKVILSKLLMLKSGLF